MIPDVQAAGLSHLLLQEGVSLAPQQQDWRSNMVLAQGKGAKKTNKEMFLSACIYVCKLLASFPCCLFILKDLEMFLFYLFIYA